MQRIQKRFMQKEKIGYKTEFIDVKARSAFKINKITMSMPKCAHGHNHYGERDAKKNAT